MTPRIPTPLPSRAALAPALAPALALALAGLLPFVTACDLLLGGGDECASDADCRGDDLCDNGACVECENDRDCDDDEECNDGECEEAGEGEGEGGEGEGEGEGGEGEGEGPCDDATFPASCNGDDITLCVGGVTEVVSCSSEFYTTGTGEPLVEPTFSCVVPAASGTVPPPLRAQCWGEGNGAVCQGVVGLMAQGNDALLIGCAPGFSCTVGAESETCQPAPSSCSATGGSCDGDTLTICAFGGDGFVFSDPLVLDCALVGGTCFESAGAAACLGGEGALCSEQGFASVCDTGFVCTPDGTGLGTCTAAE